MMTNEVLIGLDVGDVRVGVAVYREGIILPRESFPRAQGEAEQRILKLIEEIGAKKLVVGMPYDETGAETQQCLKVEQFCRRLKRRTELPIVYVDEYGSSADSEERLRALSSSAADQRRRGMIDAESATIILQSFLDGEKRETKDR